MQFWLYAKESSPAIPRPEAAHEGCSDKSVFAEPLMLAFDQVMQTLLFTLVKYPASRWLFAQSRDHWIP